MKKMFEEEMAKTLEGLEGMHRAEAPAFFYTRLTARMDARKSRGKVGIIFRPSISLAALALLLILNIGMISRFMRSADQSVQERSGLQSLVSEMSRDLSSVYNDKPTQ